MTIKSRIEKIESRTPKRKEQGPDLSGLTDEELRILSEAHTRQNLSREDEARINDILFKIPGNPFNVQPGGRC